MIQYASGGKESFSGKRVALSGSGNVAQYAALKVIELGGHVLSLSDSKGSLMSTSATGFTPADIAAIGALKLTHGYLPTFHATAADRFTWHAGARPWTLVQKIDVALPCATQNEVSGEEALHLIKAGATFVAEGSNMGSTQEAIDHFEATRDTATPIWYAPGKASNCGGVAVSGLEMAQNSARLTWTSEEVDEKLKGIMAECYKICYETGAMYAPGKGKLPSLVAGANIAGFKKVADASKAQGDWF